MQIAKLMSRLKNVWRAADHESRNEGYIFDEICGTKIAFSKSYISLGVDTSLTDSIISRKVDEFLDVAQEELHQNTDHLILKLLALFDILTLVGPPRILISDNSDNIFSRYAQSRGIEVDLWTRDLARDSIRSAEYTLLAINIPEEALFRWVNKFPAARGIVAGTKAITGSDTPSYKNLGFPTDETRTGLLLDGAELVVWSWPQS